MISGGIMSFLPAGQFKSKGPHEVAGPCPKCGGKDRFIVWPDRPRGGAYMCRGCGASGDGVQFLRDFEGYTFAEACAAVGIDKGRPSFAAGRRRQWGTAKQAQSKRETQAPARAEYPGPEWQATAQVFLSSCRVEPVRGLTAETCGVCGIFVNPADRYPERMAWGLENYTGADGKAHTKTLLPRGIVIATRRKAGLVGGTIRCPDEDRQALGRPKFKDFPGGAQVPFFAGAAGVPVVIVESAIDAALVWQASGGRLAGVALMGSTKELDADTAAFLRTAPALIVAPDFDAAGAKAERNWLSIFPGAVECFPLAGKDLGERPDLCPRWCELALEKVAETQAKTGGVSAVSRDDRDVSETLGETRGANTDSQIPAALPVPYAPDMLDGRPVCYLPQETPERLRGILPPDLRGLGVPMQGLPLSLRGISACGWKLEMLDGRLKLSQARADARNAEGVAAYVRIHGAAIAEEWQHVRGALR